jgi:hypothetical protein
MNATSSRIQLMSKPRTCVVIPVSPRHKYLYISTAINACQHVSTVFVINDSPEPLPLTKEITETFPNIVFLENHENYGLTFSLSKWYNCYCDYDFIIRTDAGDYDAPHRFLAQIQFLQERPSLSFCGCSALLLFNSSTRRNRLISFASTRPWIVRIAISLYNPFVHGSICIRGASFRAIGGYSSTYKTCQDLDLYFRLLGIGHAAILPQLLHSHYFDNNSTTLTKKHSNLTNTISIRRNAIKNSGAFRLLIFFSVYYYKMLSIAAKSN